MNEFKFRFLDLEQVDPGALSAVDIVAIEDECDVILTILSDCDDPELAVRELCGKLRDLGYDRMADSKLITLVSVGAVEDGLYEVVVTHVTERKHSFYIKAKSANEAHQRSSDFIGDHDFNEDKISHVSSYIDEIKRL